ncbi:MAG TPA: amidohydrolase family protein [Candidatus Deferrimicrobium sp.]|nr:amidohydrolase family protein [Candidatus Deferrimicrobium sp.]
MKSQFHIFEGYGFFERMIGHLEKIKPTEESNIVLRTYKHAKRVGLDKIVLLSASENENTLMKNWVELKPDFFIPFYNPPEKSENPEDIHESVEQALGKDGFKGLKILLPFRSKVVNEKKLYPAYEVAKKYDVPILFHTGYPPPGTPGHRMQLNKANPALLDEVIASFPKLRIIMSHCGYPWSDVAIALACQFPNVYLDISNLMYMMPNKMRDILLHAKEVIGLNKILFGSDGFCPEMVEVCVQLCESIDYLTSDEKKKILGLNAQKLLKLG